MQAFTTTVGASSGYGVTSTDMPQESGLIRIASQIERATSEIEGISAALNNVAMGIHGPRPEPVNNSVSASNAPGSDSLATRVSHLMSAIERLQRSYESIVR